MNGFTKRRISWNISVIKRRSTTWTINWGHPITDPHGTVIPVDSDQSTGEQDVKASMLRRGNRARIQQILPAASALGLTVGSEITALPRSDNGQTWNLEKAQGEAIAINHQQAGCDHCSTGTPNSRFLKPGDCQPP